VAKAAARQGKLFEADAGKVEGKVEAAKKAPAPSPAPAPVPAEPAAAAGPRPVPAPSRRVSAETLAKGQREISVSEFFVKNRHLLGFDNPPASPHRPPGAPMVYSIATGAGTGLGPATCANLLRPPSRP